MEFISTFRTFLILAMLVLSGCAQSVFNDPSAGACSDAGAANTGNGTCTISQVSYAAVSEALTFTATSAGPIANFSVTGATSGALTSIQSGSAQTVLDSAGLPVVSVTLSDGGTPYVIGDNFTVTLTAGTELKKSNFDLLTLAQVCSNGCAPGVSLQHVAGTVSVPAFAFADDADGSGTGLYRVGANSLGFTANGVNVGQYTSGGVWTLGSSGNTGTHTINGTRVNIQSASGQDSVFSLLTTSANANARAYVIQEGSSTSGAAYYVAQIASGNKWSMGNDTANSNQFNIANTDGYGDSTKFYFRINTSGGVTIGATSGTQTHTVNGNLTTTGQLSGKGTSTNDNAAAGYIGEYTEALFNGTNAGATTVWTNMASLSLTAGDWDVCFQSMVDDQGATVTTGIYGAAISANSGNTITDHVLGDNRMEFAVDLGSDKQGAGTVCWRRPVASTTTYYGKAQITYSAGGPPKYWGKMWARRMR